MKAILILLLIFPHLTHAQNGEELIAGRKKISVQTYSLTATGLALAGSFPVNLKHAFEIKGFDQASMSYQVRIETAETDQGFFKTTYHLSNNGKERSGSIVTKSGESGKMNSKTDGRPADSISFETKVTE
jgi:hypothetical protein